MVIMDGENHNIKILHAGVGKEVRISGVKVDGYCTETKQVFEFHGCYYHGHPECFKNRRNELIGGNIDDTLNNRYLTTIT